MRSISGKLVLVLSLCCGLTLAGGIAVDYRYARTEILRQLQEQARERGAASLGDMEVLLQGVEGSTRLLARIISQGDYPYAELDRLARTLVEGNADIFGATIALAGDGPYAPYYFRDAGRLKRLDLATARVDYQTENWFSEARSRGRPVWVEPYLDRNGSGVLMTTFSVPVLRPDSDGQSHLYAVVTADMPLDMLHEYLRRLPLGNGADSLLLSRDGVILSARSEELHARHYSQLSENPNWTPLLRAALSGESSNATLPCPLRPGDCEIYVAPLRSTGWPLVLLYSHDQLLRPLRRLSLRSALVGLASLAAVVIAVLLLSRRLTRPLTALAEASTHIARGQMRTPLPRPRGRDEVARLVSAFGHMSNELERHMAELQQATARRSRLEGELSAARDIQMEMLPGNGELKRVGAVFDLWCLVRPARSVGGDLYCCEEQAGKLLFAVGDVSDKGVPAALFMARTMGLLQQHTTDSDPAATLAQLNEALVQGNDNCMFVTLWLGSLHLQSGELQFASAGHPPPLLVQGGTADEAAQNSGPALGLAPGLEFPLNRVRLQPGQRLCLYTDGIEEAFDEAGAMFGLPRLRQNLLDSLDKSPRQAGYGLLDTVDRFRDGRTQSDDITLMLLDYGCARASFELGQGLVSRVLDWLRPVLAGVDADLRRELCLLAEEIVVNVWEHSGLQAGDTLSIELRRSDTDISLTVRDRGRAFDPLSEARQADLGLASADTEVGGLGVHLIGRLADQQHYRREDGENILQVSRQLRQ